MSSYGIVQAQLIAQQKEAERQRRVRQQCLALAEMIDQDIHAIAADPGLTTFIEDLNEIQNQVKSARSLVGERPDEALEHLKKFAGSVHELSARARSRQEQWSDERELVYRNVSLLLDTLRSMPVETPAYRTDMEALIRRLERASTIVLTSSELRAMMEEIECAARNITNLDEREISRKIIVRQVIDLLSTRGFQVGQPKIKDTVVHLQARMPSGKEILLQIFDDAKIHFDFERYDGMACKDELDAILQKLETDGQIQTCIEQFVWHNPDKIKKGAKEFPYGQSQQRYMK